MFREQLVCSRGAYYKYPDLGLNWYLGPPLCRLLTSQRSVVSYKMEPDTGPNFGGQAVLYTVPVLILKNPLSYNVR